MRSTLLVLGLVLLAGAARANTAPNVVVILIDDVGIDQLRIYDDENSYTDPDGYPYAYTPNIDALAANGVRFTQYRTMPVCSPTRAALLSGCYPLRNGTGASVKVPYVSPTFVEFNRQPAPRFLLLPTLLGKFGYATAVVGKWHLALEPNQGGTLDLHPTNVGFQTWWGLPGNLDAQPGGASGGGYYDFAWVENMTRTQVQGIHASEHTVSRAEAWIGSAQQPYFLYLALSACHAPHGGANWPPGQHGFGPTPPPINQVNTGYRACLEHADAKLGELLATLDPNTYVILAGDNGTVPPAFRIPAGEVRYPIGHPSYQPGDELKPLDVSPYKSWQVKKSVYEGGIRVPLIVSGPGVVAPGSTSAELVDVVDLYPTVLKLAGAPPSKEVIDGTDFSKLLTQPFGRGRRDFSYAEFFLPNGVSTPALRQTQKRAYVRRAKKHLWKLVHIIENDPTQPLVNRYEFYHLAGPAVKTPVDPLEQNDLGTSHPAFQQTQRAYLEFVGKN